MSHFLFQLIMVLPSFCGSEGQPEWAFSKDGRILVFYPGDLKTTDMLAEVHFFDHTTRDETLSFQRVEDWEPVVVQASESVAYALLKANEIHHSEWSGQSAHRQWKVLTSQNENSHEMVLKNFCKKEIQVTLTRKSFDGMVLDQRRIRLGREREKAFPLDEILPPIELTFIEVDATQPVGLSLSTSRMLLGQKASLPSEPLNPSLKSP